MRCRDALVADKVVARLVEFYLAEKAVEPHDRGPHFFAGRPPRRRAGWRTPRSSSARPRTARGSSRRRTSGCCCLRGSARSRTSAPERRGHRRRRARLAGHRETLSAELAHDGRQSNGRLLRRGDRPDAGAVLRPSDAGGSRRGQVHRRPSHPTADSTNRRPPPRRSSDRRGGAGTQVQTAPSKRRELAELAIAADVPMLAALRAEGASRRRS